MSRLEAPIGTKGWPFILVGGSNRDKRLRGPFVPVGVSNRDKTPWPPYPLSSSPARAIQLTCFLMFLARDSGVLAHFFTTFVKIFDSPVHPSALKVWGLFFSSFLAFIAHFML